MSVSPSDNSVMISKQSRSSSPPPNPSKVHHKRKRQTLSCLQCKKRKTKCDKARPCSTCIARQEGSTCEYDDGASPPPQSAYVHVDQFLDLKRRLENLEARVGRPDASSHNPSPMDKVTAGNTTTTLSMGGTDDDRFSFNERILTPQPNDGNGVGFGSSSSFSISQDVQRHRQKLEDVEQAFSAVEGLAHTLVSTVDGQILISSASDMPTGNSRPQAWGEWTTIMQQGPSYPHRSPKWVRDMKEALTTIPEKRIVDQLIIFFFSELYPSRPQLHKGIFLQEVAQFEALRGSPDSINIDPGWLVLFLSVLWVSAHSIMDEAENSPHPAALGLSRPQLQSLTLALFEQLESTCNCARWLCFPQMRILYALLIGMPFKGRGPFTSFHPSWSWDRASTNCMWFEVCIAIAKKLRVHRLGSDDDPKPLPDDPMLPKHLPLYSRQMALRAFHNLKLYDTCTYCSCLGVTPGPPTMFLPDGTWDSAEPSNYTDEDLLNNDSKPQSLNELSPIIWQLHKFRIAPHWRRIIESNPATITYDKILAIDADLRKDLECITSLKLYNNLDDRDNLSFWITSSSYHQRLIRLHRPFYSQTFHDEKYQFSRSAALSAARQILHSHRTIISRYGPLALVRDSLYLFTHHLSATIVIFLEALYNPPNLDAMRKELQLSSDILREAGSDTRRVFAGVGFRGHLAVVAMLRILESPPNELESVTRLLKDIENIANHNPIVLPSKPNSELSSTDGQPSQQGYQPSNSDPMQSAAQFLLGQALQPSSLAPIPMSNDPLPFNFDLAAGWSFPSEEFGVLPGGKSYDFTFEGMFAGL